MITNSNNDNTSNNASNNDNATKNKVVIIDDDHPLTTITKNSHLQLSFLPSSSSLSSQSPSQSQLPSQPIIKIAIWKDTRLKQLDISKVLIEILHINGFTIERIVEYGALKITQILRIDEHYAQIIFNEATKRIN